MSTPVFAALVAALGLVLVVVAFVAAPKVFTQGASDCERVQDEIVSLMDRVGDPTTLDSTPADSRLLTALGEELRATCTYYDTIDFEATVVFPWLGVDPNVPLEPDATAVPTPSAPSD